LGYVSTVVEHYNSFSKKKKDLWGFGDILSLNHGSERPILSLQVTSRSNVSARRSKMMSDTLPNKDKIQEPNKIKEKVIEWLMSGGYIFIIGWDNEKLKDKSGRLIEIYLDGDILSDRELDVNTLEVAENAKSKTKKAK
jgi:hypothetical protein